MPGSEGLASYDVVLVPFPFSDRLAEKRRPAVVVSRPSLQRDHGHVWLTMVTSARHDPWDADVPIADLASAGLPSPSVVRTAKITTVEASRILRRLGRLDAATTHAVRDAIREQLG